MTKDQPTPPPVPPAVTPPKPSPWYVTIIKVAVALALLTTAVVLIRFTASGKQDAEARREVRPVNVRIFTVVEQPMREIVRLPGTLIPYREVKLSAELSGRVVDVALEEGSALPTDPAEARKLVLLTIDPSDLQQQLKDTRTTAELARLDYDKARELYNQSPPAIGKFELDTKKLKYDMARSKVEIVETQLAKCYVRSPITGLLNTVVPEQGEYVVPGRHVATVVQTDRLKAVVGLPEVHAPFVKLGDPVEVMPTFAENEQIRGQVSYLSMVADEATKTYRCEITIDNPGGLLRPGMIVRVFIVRRIIPKARPVPLSAVIPAEGRQLVFVEVNGRAVERAVKLDQITGNRVNVVDGLDPGEHLIVDGQRQLRNNQEVKVVGPDELVDQSPPISEDVSIGTTPDIPGQPSWKTN